MRRLASDRLEAAEGVYRLGTRWANFYLVVDDGEATLVDAGYPGYLQQLEQLASSRGIRLDAIRAVVVTHHHVDHTGTAEAVRSRHGASVFVGADDAAKVRGERPSHPPQGFWGEAWRPSMISYLIHSARAGGARYRPVAELTTLTGDQLLDVPGRPRVIATPGHTAGHYSVLLEERGVLLCGDAMVSFDYATGKRGLALHRFNEDVEGARAAVGGLKRFNADTVLFGHGNPWTKGLDRAIDGIRESAP